MYRTQKNPKWRHKIEDEWFFLSMIWIGSSFLFQLLSNWSFFSLLFVIIIIAIVISTILNGFPSKCYGLRWFYAFFFMGMELKRLVALCTRTAMWWKNALLFVGHPHHTASDILQHDQQQQMEHTPKLYNIKCICNNRYFIFPLNYFLSY